MQKDYTSAFKVDFASVSHFALGSWSWDWDPVSCCIGI